MPKGGPSAFAGAAADGFAWAHNTSGSCCRCPRVGPLIFRDLLQMSKSGPITFATAAASDGFAWAH